MVQAVQLLCQGFLLGLSSVLWPFEKSNCIVRPSTSQPYVHINARAHTEIDGHLFSFTLGCLFCCSPFFSGLVYRECLYLWPIVSVAHRLCFEMSVNSFHVCWGSICLALQTSFWRGAMGASPSVRALHRDGKVVKHMRGPLAPTGSSSP